MRRTSAQATKTALFAAGNGVGSRKNVRRRFFPIDKGNERRASPHAAHPCLQLPVFRKCLKSTSATAVAITTLTISSVVPDVNVVPRFAATTTVSM
jgi:hypothetical protein